MKKTEIITIRMTENTKKKIEKRANKNEWSIAQTANKIIENYFSIPDERYYTEDKISKEIYLSKHNEDIITEVSKKLNCEWDDAANYIINYFAIQWPFDE